MEKNKGISIAIIILAASIFLSSVMIFMGMQSISNAYDKMRNFAEVEAKKNIQYGEIMELKEAARYLHISEEKLLKIVKKQEFTIPYFGMDERYFFSKSALDKWVTEQSGITENWEVRN